MTVTQKGWSEELMMSCFTKEDAYNAGATAMTAIHACSLKHFDPLGVEWDDVVSNDKGAVTGQEHGTDQEITQQGVKLTLVEPNAKPNTIAALATLVLGSCVTVKDSTDDAYRHTIEPVAHETALPSMELGHKKGTIQHRYRGVKGNSLKLSAEAGGYVKVECEMIGSGDRAISATAFPAIIDESWLRTSQAEVKFETGANITISATLQQGAEDISSATPDDFGTRIQGFEFAFNNNGEKQMGFGGDLVAHDFDYGRRTIELKFTLLMLASAAAAEIAYYTAQDACAFELDIIGAQIDTSAPAGIPLLFGLHIIIPRGKLRAAPLPQGGPDDMLTVEFELDVQNDGTNPACTIETYNAQPGNGIDADRAYLAASS